MLEFYSVINGVINVLIPSIDLDIWIWTVSESVRVKMCRRTEQHPCVLSDFTLSDWLTAATS